MFLSAKFQVSFVLLVALVLLPTVGRSQTGNSSSSAFSDGVFQTRIESIQKLFRLGVKGKSIGLDRDWGPINRSKQLEVETKNLIDRGMNERIAARLAEQLVPGGFQSHPLIHAFSQVRSPFGSYSQSGSSKRWKLSFRGPKMSGELNFTSDVVKMQLRERVGDRRTISLQDSNDGSILIGYSGPGFEIEFVQTQDVVILKREWNGKTEEFKGEDFTDFQRKHAKLFNTWLLPVLEHTGFDMPIAITSPAVKQAVLDRLSVLQSRSNHEFDSLLDDLDSDEFKIRDKATEVLRNRLDIWSDEIRRALDSSDLSAEAKNRLQILLSNKSSNNSVAELVRINGLVDDPAYLVSLFEFADQQETKALIRRLKEITKQDFSSQDQWREFIQSLN